MGPELWNATPDRTLRYITEAATAAEPLFRRWQDRLTFCVGNELTLFMRGIVPGRSHARRSRSPALRAIVLSAQHMLRAFLAEAAASVRSVYRGPITYCALPFGRVDWDQCIPETNRPRPASSSTSSNCLTAPASTERSS
jgi:hypothetical protein